MCDLMGSKGRTDHELQLLYVQRLGGRFWTKRSNIRYNCEPGTRVFRKKVTLPGSVKRGPPGVTGLPQAADNEANTDWLRHSSSLTEAVAVMPHLTVKSWFDHTSALVRVMGILLFVGLPNTVQAQDGKPVDFKTKVLPLLQKYCHDCHSGDEAEAGLDLSKAKSLGDVRSKRRSWEKVFAFVRIQAMPPSDADQPTEEERKLLIDWLDHTLFYVDCDKNPNPGRVTVRRLNRTEYNNTVRDLVGVDFQPADDFPSDDVGYGFDNIGDVLSISPLLMEKYLDASEQIASKAITAPEDVGIREQQTADDFGREGSADDGPQNSIVMASTGAVWSEFEFPASGQYIIRIEAAADQAGKELAGCR